MAGMSLKAKGILTLINNNNNNNNNIYRGSPTRQGGFQWGPQLILIPLRRKILSNKPFTMSSLKSTDPGVRRSVVYLPGNKGTLGNNELS